MQHLKRNLLSVALASATMMVATGAWAQSTTTTDPATPAQDPQATPQDQESVAKQQAKQLQTVTVQGIRVGIEQANTIKKESTSIVEAISAEDIGKLPDISIAESISRLPGIAAQRVGGRAQVISVRGLSPDFATTLLNGREMVSTGDNRSVEFDQYPSELMSGVVVYKTPDSALVGQGLSGTIDMRTVRPLDFDKPVYAVSARYQDNSLGSAANAEGDGNRINASVITQMAGGDIGLSLGFSHSDIPIQEEQTGLYEPWQLATRNGIPNPTYVTDGAKALRRTGYVRRNAAMATVQFAPIAEWTSTLDIFHTSAVQEDTANQFEANFNYNGNPDPQTWTPNINGNGTLVGGTLTNAYPLVRGMYNKREDSIDGIGWANEIKLGEVNLTADVSWSKSHRDEMQLENNLQLLPNPQFDTLNLSFGDGFATIQPGRDYSNPGSLFIANTIYGSGYGKTPKVVDELKGFKLNANFAAPFMTSFFSDVDVGAHYGTREKSKRQPEGNINLGAQGPTTIAPDLQYGLVDLTFAGVGYIPSWDVPGAVARYMTFIPGEDASYLVPKAWTINEDITTGWLRANIDTTWGSIPVRGNVGIQAQHTDQSSSSFYWDPFRPVGQNRVPFEEGKSYTDWLPSLNLAFSLPHDQTLRVAAARQLARARLDQMRASFEFGVNTATLDPAGSGGNPLLDPWKANAFDISYEKYFEGTKGYVSAAFYYKDLRTYIFTESRAYDFTQFITPDVIPQPDTNIGQFTAPYNGKGGYLQGLELTASLPLEIFWDAAQGFGFIASASFNDSNITIPPDPSSVSSVGSQDITLPGLSDEVYNLTAYYSRAGFEARVNQRWRSDYIGEISNFAAERTLRYVEGEDITDAQLSYSFGEASALKGLTLLLQANNLTNSGYRTYASTKDRPLENIEWGRTYLLGVSYKF
ncbi:TonB-dependent receptor [Lysobacter dokdonensis DS-58]|uniref:TonB-dependent receptor n=1 Tax=Lysobacter dokdonensis DS-58 TaxID=1300345 RepID=A0A0A2WK25_9GAMM|nr:TonB-dependent receptor [Lysobacter dokdonensis]KGQ20536.1 TonB-dependent receptor [Lysobacter dokdonensis DS-58]